MATLRITFSKSIPPGGGGRNLPIADGSNARSETLDFSNTAGTDISALSCAAGEDIVEVYADADCWVSMVASPSPAAETGWFVAAGWYRHFWVDAGEKVGVAAA